MVGLRKQVTIVVKSFPTVVAEINQPNILMKYFKAWN